MSLAYSHDPAGRITRKQGNNDDWRYQYDPAERLIQATGLAESHDYQYDELGNRLDIGGQYDPANRIQQDATYDYTFDERGNLIAKVDKTTGERHEYTYNADNRLVCFERYPAGSDTPDITATYTYDPFGRRIEKRVNGETTTFQWFGSQLIAEYDAAGSVTQRYHYAEGYAPVQVEDANGTYQVHSDHLDTPGSLTDPTGTVVWKAAYAPYGSAVVDEDPDGDGTAVTFNIRFPGQYEDAESGHYYNYLRDYDPSTGRYIESDPIGLEGGLNTYAYVLNDPINLSDPLGLWSISFGGYAGPGGEISFGRDANTGQGFMNFRFGFGLGGGISWDPLGMRPGSSPAEACQGGGFGLGVFGDIGFNAGPLQAGLQNNLGRNYPVNGDPTHYGQFMSPSVSFGDSLGIKAGASAGGQITIYSAR